MGSLVLSLLLGSLVFVHDLLFGSFLGGSCSLTLFDFSDGFFGKSLLFFRTSILEFFNILESDTFNSSLLSENSFLFVFSSIGYF
ncbi:MAG: hypothetical protein KDD45_02435 [Bdellovibrionales bacterium]|nr:hypothetical protein [Bdellovibrionales bacterium]